MRKWIKGSMLALSLAITPVIAGTVIQANDETNHVKENRANHIVIWESLKKEGYSDYATASVLANIEAESLADPEYIQGGRTLDQFVKGATGIGIGQWVSAQQQDALFNFAEKRDRDWRTLGLQVDFLIEDLENSNWLDARFKDFEDFKTTDDLDKATKMLCQGYFKPSDQGTWTINERLGFAISFMKKYSSLPVTPEKEEVKTEETKQEVKTEETKQEVKQEKEAKETEKTKTTSEIKPQTKTEKENKEITQTVQQPQTNKQQEDIIEYSPLTETITTKITTSMETATANIKPYSNISISNQVIEGTSKVMPVMSIGSFIILGFFLLGGVTAEKLGYIDMIEDRLLIKGYRRRLENTYSKCRKDDSDES